MKLKLTINKRGYTHVLVRYSTNDITSYFSTGISIFHEHWIPRKEIVDSVRNIKKSKENQDLIKSAESSDKDMNRLTKTHKTRIESLATNFYYENSRYPEPEEMRELLMEKKKVEVTPRKEDSPFIKEFDKFKKQISRN